jgi:IclR family KDG regulon transcriptional repressor
MTETQSLIRAIAILDCFCPETPELGVREIARRLHLPASTVGRLLLTFHVAGILQQDPATRLYRMGPRVLQWSSVYVGRLDLAKESRPVLEEFARITRETVSVYVLDGTTRVCLERIESPERVRVVIRPGERMPLHAGSSGKAILAFMPPKLVKQILAKPLERMTVHTITNRRKLLQDLELVRARGYATSHCERFDDALGLGAPIFNASGEVIAALNVAGPIMRFTDAEVEKFAPKIIQLASQISMALGYTGALGNLRSGVNNG